MPTDAEQDADEPSAGPPVSSVMVRSDPAASDLLSEHDEAMVRSLCAVLDSLRGRAGLEAQAVEIIVALDLAATVRRLNGSITGVEDLATFGIERIAGEVAGKTMFRDAEHRNAIVVMAASLFAHQTPFAQLTRVSVAGHELAHTYLGQLRAAGGAPMQPTYLPWEIARWQARYAFEEYLADRLAEALLASMCSLDDGVGTTRPASFADLGESGPGFVAAAATAFDALPKRIHDYRVGDCPLEVMWNDVQLITTQILNTLAHAQAWFDRPDGVPTSLADDPLLRGKVPLALAWQGLSGLLKELPLITTPVRFVAAEAAAINAAGELIVAMWASLGLTFAPHGDNFRIDVAAPWTCWPDLDPAAN